MLEVLHWCNTGAGMTALHPISTIDNKVQTITMDSINSLELVFGIDSDVLFRQ